VFWSVAMQLLRCSKVLVKWVVRNIFYSPNKLHNKSDITLQTFSGIIMP